MSILARRLELKGWEKKFVQLAIILKSLQSENGFYWVKIKNKMQPNDQKSNSESTR